MRTVCGGPGRAFRAQQQTQGRKPTAVLAHGAFPKGGRCLLWAGGPACAIARQKALFGTERFKHTKAAAHVGDGFGFLWKADAKVFGMCTCESINRKSGFWKCFGTKSSLTLCTQNAFGRFYGIEYALVARFMPCSCLGIGCEFGTLRWPVYSSATSGATLSSRADMCSTTKFGSWIVRL